MLATPAIISAFTHGLYFDVAVARPQEAKEQRPRMRWKLLIITSLVASIVGAGSTLGLAFGLTGAPKRPVVLNLYAMLTFLIPLASIFFASLFVYRHTARWRKVQALSTALLSILLTLTILVAAFMFLGPGPAGPEMPPPLPPSTT
jgi:amino acid transporter